MLISRPETSEDILPLGACSHFQVISLPSVKTVKKKKKYFQEVFPKFHLILIILFPKYL